MKAIETTKQEFLFSPDFARILQKFGIVVVNSDVYLLLRCEQAAAVAHAVRRGKPDMQADEDFEGLKDIDLFAGLLAAAAQTAACQTYMSPQQLQQAETETVELLMSA